MGALVGAAAAKNIKPCTLELGGKSAAIVWKDVDIDQVCVPPPSRAPYLARAQDLPATQLVYVDLLAQAAGVAPARRWYRRRTTRSSSTTASAAQPVSLEEATPLHASISLS